MKLSVASLGCLLLSIAFFSSCKKESSEQGPEISSEETVTITEENASADAEDDEITEIAFSAGADLEVTTSSAEVSTTVDGSIFLNADFFEELSFRLGPCARITQSSREFPKTIIINYGDGCLCRDGKFRKGAIVLHYTAPIRRPGAVVTITFRNYFVNRAHITGTKVISNLSAGGVHKFSVAVENGGISWPNGRGFRFEGIKTVVQLEGSDTRTLRDDVWAITLRNKTLYANGWVVVKNTETPLIKKMNCKWIVQGVLKISINSRELFLDYGNGDCDNKALLKWSGGETVIILN